MPPSMTYGFSWPAKGDQLFRPSTSWEQSIHFADHEIARHAHIWIGYMRAGFVLIEECERNPGARPDLVYPILFCYRHGLECALKWIISRHGHLLGSGSEHINHHDLWLLWKSCRPLLEGGSGDDGAIDAVEQIIKDFHEVDKRSYSFRYSAYKKGLIVDLPDRSIDLINIKEVMEGVNGFFNGADGSLGSVSYEGESY